MYSSWWFITLLGIFSLNLIFCSIKRLPHVLTFISQPALVLSDTMQKAFSLKQEVTFKAPLDIAGNKLAEFLKAELASPVVTQRDNSLHLFAQRNAWCRLGVYVVHASILVIFAGAIIGSLFGEKGFVNISEGDSVSAFMSTRTGKETNLGFTVRCDQFTVAKYASGAPKEFKSILTILENGKPVPDYVNARIIVNDPLTYKGYTFYQSSYGQADEGSEHYLTVAHRGGSDSQRITIHKGESVTLKDGTSVKLVAATQEVQQIIPELSGPGAQIEVVFKGKSPQMLEVFKNYPEINAQRGDELIFGYEGTNAKMYTGLQVAKDPGVWVVWIGCALMIAGLCIAFFMSHKRVWIVVTKGHARMYGNASKNQAAFAMLFDDLSAKLKKLQI